MSCRCGELSRLVRSAAPLDDARNQLTNEGSNPMSINAASNVRGGNAGSSPTAPRRVCVEAVGSSDDLRFAAGRQLDAGVRLAE